LQLKAASEHTRTLRPSCGQFIPMQLDHLPCFDDPSFRFPDPSFKLRSSDLSFCQFPAPHLKVSPQLNDHPLRVSHRGF
jgi:hypothetical protein